VLFYESFKLIEQAGERKIALDQRLSHLKRNCRSENSLRIDQVKEMLAGLKDKSFEEKITAAYDASIMTHDIGFPQSRSTKKSQKHGHPDETK